MYFVLGLSEFYHLQLTSVRELKQRLLI